MKNKSSKTIMKLNQLADVLVVEKRENNSDGEEMKKKTLKI